MTEAKQSTRITSTRLDDIESLRSRWQELEESATPNPFLSWLWIGSWLGAREEWPETFEVSVWRKDRRVALAVACITNSVRARLIRTNVLNLNEAGDDRVDATIEHNGFLCDEGLQEEVLSTFLDFVTREFPRVDEVVISGIDSSLLERLRDRPGWNWTPNWSSNCYFLDLKALRSSEAPLLDSLGRRRRYQVRRSIRAYESFGEISVERAENLDDAFAMYSELRDFHDAHWKSRGEDGAFGTEERRNFYSALITNGVQKGSVDLVRVSAGDKPIGLLLNLKANGRVYYVQSGFNYALEPKRQPGYVTLVLAIQRYASEGEDCFDMLAGHEDYKRELATEFYELHWGSFRRDRLKFRVESMLRRLTRNFVHFVGYKQAD